MATRRFCDICDAALTADDDAPLVRVLDYAMGAATLPSKAFAYVSITNEQNHPLTDVCIGCKLKIVTYGHPAPKVAPIATLQPQVAHGTPVETPFFRLPEKPPTMPPGDVIHFEPSLPTARRPPAHQGDIHKQEQQQQQ